VDIIRRPHIEDNGTKENTGGEHRPELKAHRRCYSAEGFQFGAIARFASLISATPLDEVKGPAPVRGFFNAPASSAAVRNFRLYNRIRPEAADTRQIDVGALARERDATDWVPSSESRIWDKPGVTAGREPAERL
jgi:hypothetical protein